MATHFTDFYQQHAQDHLPPHGEEENVLEKIKTLKAELCNDVVILGHHYQQDDIIQFADITGDSLQLAREAVKLKGKKYIIFCGVHFMAETADMLSCENQQVILPDLRAGCSMADMAQISDINRAWEFLNAALEKLTPAQKIVPITYINCAADLKSFVGKHQGSICTSSNAQQVIQWGFSQGEKLLFFPDQHLGRNTCFELGIPLEKMVIYDPRRKNGGLTVEQVQAAKVILWYGYCSVHQGFKKEHVELQKSANKDTIVLVHPECSFDVVQAADLHGSTSYIIEQIQKAPAGTRFAVGTEINLVQRLARLNPHLHIESLSPYQCLCTTMYRVRPEWLLASLRSIKAGKAENVIKVAPEIKINALKALETMLYIH